MQIQSASWNCGWDLLVISVHLHSLTKSLFCHQLLSSSFCECFFYCAKGALFCYINFYPMVFSLLTVGPNHLTNGCLFKLWPKIPSKNHTNCARWWMMVLQPLSIHISIRLSISVQDITPYSSVWINVIVSPFFLRLFYMRSLMTSMRMLPLDGFKK